MGKSKTSVRHKEWKKSKDQQKIDYAKLNKINEERYMMNMSLLARIVPNIESYQRGELSKEGLDLTIVDYITRVKESDPVAGKHFEGYFKKNIVPKIEEIIPNVNELLPEQFDGSDVLPIVDSELL